MSGTVRTLPYLLSTQWADSGSGGRDTPSSVRDLIVSIPYILGYGITTGQAFPALQANVVTLSLYPGITYGAGQTLGTRQANATALQAACDYCATNKYYLWAPAGIIEIDNTAGITWSDYTKYQDFRWFGTVDTTIIQFHANAPILTIGDVGATTTNFTQGMCVDGINLQYGVAQTGNASAISLRFGNVGFSDFRNFFLSYGGTTMIPYIAVWFNSTGGSSFFSNTLSNFVVYGAQYRIWSFEMNATGNYFCNIYLNNLLGGTLFNVSDSAFVIDATGGGFLVTDQHYDRLNIEYVGSGHMVLVHNATGIKFSTLHFENVTFTGASPRLFYNIGAQIHIDTMLAFNLGINTGNFSSTAACFGAYGTGTTTVVACNFVQSSPLVTQNASMTLVSQDGPATPTFGRTATKIIATSISGWDSFPISVDGTLAAATYGNARYLDGYNYPAVYPMAKAAVIANPPTSYILPGCWGQEVVVLFDAPIGALVNIALGPNYMLGSDKGSTIKRPVGHQVVVVRDTTCTGNFNITVRDSTTGGTLLGTFTGSASAGTSLTFGWSGTAWAAI